MSISLIGTIEPFDYSKTDLDTYLERFEIFLKLNSIQDDYRKVALFIVMMGPEAFYVLKTLCVPDSPANKAYKDIIEILKNHLQPKTITSIERFKFYKRDQRQGETTAEYAVELKKLARTCDFKSFLEDALRDRFICGLSNDRLQKKLLSEGELSFEQAYEKAVRYELALRLISKSYMSSLSQLERKQEPSDIHKLDKDVSPGKKCKGLPRCFRCFRLDYAKKLSSLALGMMFM